MRTMEAIASIIKDAVVLFDLRVKQFLAGGLDRIREINRKYAKPRIPMTRMVNISLLFLRLYLIFLVGLLIFKFWTLL